MSGGVTGGGGTSTGGAGVRAPPGAGNPPPVPHRTPPATVPSASPPVHPRGQPPVPPPRSPKPSLQSQTAIQAPFPPQLQTSPAHAQPPSRNGTSPGRLSVVSSSGGNFK